MNKQFFIPFSVLLLSVAIATARPDLSGGRRGPTPYDPYHGALNTVFERLNGDSPDFGTVAALVRRSHQFRYVFDTPYLPQTPRETEARRAGDCKAKSLWLASKMNDRALRYVIGKARRDSKISHAWLMWQHKGRWWILDPTNAAEPIPAESVGAGDYTVFYSYDQTGTYCHEASPERERPSRAVAGHR